MDRFSGAVIGMIATPVAVVVGGGVYGFLTGLAPSLDPYSFDSAYFGAETFAMVFGLPAVILGAGLGAMFCRGFRGLSIGSIMVFIASIAVALFLCMFTVITVH